ncbi:hypothetical protein LINPERHAP2_LOCUS16957 [Linum perenne]
MNFSEEWKSFFPIGSVYGAPLHLSSRDTKSVLGPLCFNPTPNSLTTLFDSPSALSPPLLNPPAQLSLPRFLLTSSYVPPSTASSVSSSFKYFGDKQESASSWLSRNRIQLLNSPHGNSAFVFFPTGSNFDLIGFLMLEEQEAKKGGRVNAVGNSSDVVFVANERLNQRIRGILVNPAAEDSSWFTGGSSASDAIGHLLAFSVYSVYWFCLRFDRTSRKEEEPVFSTKKRKKKPVLLYMGCRSFKSSPVVNACWSPHLLGESVVLLEDGSLILFDLDSPSSRSSFRGTRLKVSWDDSPESHKCKWLGCEFSWHYRILIVARSDAAFLVDWRFDEHKVTCLAKVDMFGPYDQAGFTQFQAFSNAVSSRFHFILVSSSLLVLCDVRRPLSPVLLWTHGLDKPCYVDTFRLSNLRSNSRDSTHDWATKSGFGIVLGSFLNSEFSLFCYGPPLPTPPKSVPSKIYKLSKSLYSWELPSNLNLQNSDCLCGSCLLREEFAKDTLPEWLDRNQKKDIVLGFRILSGDRCSSLSETGGFSLIRLMSSGKLELQQYCSSWDLVRTLKDHTDPLFSGANNMYSALEDEKYKFPRRFKYLDLDYLSAYLNGDLSRILGLKLRDANKIPAEDTSFGLDFHEALCEKLMNSGLNRSRESSITSLVLKDVYLPASIHDVASRKMWTRLPIELLQFAFSGYSELLNVLLDKKKVSLEFLPVPDLPQLPPFLLRKPSRRSNKWSKLVQRNRAILVGPLLPLPVLTTVHEFQNGCLNSKEEAGNFCAETELKRQCDEVMGLVKKVVGVDSTATLDDDPAVSLASENDDIWGKSKEQQPKSFIMYRPAAVRGSAGNWNSSYSRDHSYSTMITKLQSKEASNDDQEKNHSKQIFEDLCPIDLKFNDDLTEFSSMESKSYRMLKRILVSICASPSYK